MAAVRAWRGNNLTNRADSATPFGRRAGGAVGVILAALGAAPALADDAKARVIDRVVAVIDGRTLTQSELELEARVALVQRGGSAAATAPLSNSDLRAALEYSVGQRLANDEADKLQEFTIDQAEIHQAMDDLKARIGGEPALQRFLERQEADASQIEAILAREKRAEKFWDNKVRLRARTSEADVRQFYDEHEDLHGHKYEDVRSQIRDQLTEERYRGLIRQELAQARRSADVRLIAPWARGQEAEP
jgi:hypothetical protein